MKIRLLLVFLVAAAQRLSCDAARGVSLEHKDSDRKDVAIYEEKEYVRDESKETVEVITYTKKERFEKTCGLNERLLRLSIATDRYAYETSFELRRVGGGGGMIGSGPGKKRNYADSTTYNLQYCVKVGQQYRLRIKDANGDGLCCTYGQGSYRFGIDGQTTFDSKNKKTFSKVGTHTFRVRAPPSSRPSNPSPLPARPKINPTPRCITVKAQGDNFPDELSWRILDKSGQEVETSLPLKALSPVSKKVCLEEGQYTFEMMDKYGDGMCCGSGDGYVMVYLDEDEDEEKRELFRGSHFQFTKQFTIQINPPYERNMSARDRDWLNGHNTRRLKYHTEFGKEYVPLKWSPKLAQDAERWAIKLLEGCEEKGLHHEPGVDDGENLAKNRGSGKYGQLYSTENIMNRWVEKERYLGYPANAHLTQALWRASKYLGCGEAERPFNERGTCRIQVCRYAAAGNCNMRSHNASTGDNWIKPMMEAHSGCGNACAPEGCY